MPWGAKAEFGGAAIPQFASDSRGFGRKQGVRGKIDREDFCSCVIFAGSSRQFGCAKTHRV